MICILYGALGGIAFQLANIFFNERGEPSNAADFKSGWTYLGILIHGLIGALIVSAYFFSEIELNPFLSMNLGITSIAVVKSLPSDRPSSGSGTVD